jgi:hypothetical protein
MLCLAMQTRLEAVELRESSRRAREQRRASEAEDSQSRTVRQLSCPACGHSLLNAGSVLFQGDALVHARCWRMTESDGETPGPAPA